jgi:hypothetical protein
VTGDNSIAFRETAGVQGDLLFKGNINATGEGAVAMDLQGDVTGALQIYGVVQATGYRITQRPQNPEQLENLLPENMLQGGSAIQVRGDVAGGIFIGSPPPAGVGDPDDDFDDDGEDNSEDEDDDGDGIPDDEEDNDRDGVPDVDEGVGTIQVFGGAPAVVIGDTGKDVQVGKFGTEENAYGLIVRGAINAAGVFDEVSATGLQIGTGDGTVTIDGGVRIVGGVDATAFEADAVALRVMSGANANTLVVEGRLASTGVALEHDNDAYSLKIEEGGRLTSLINSGSITAAVTGETGSAYAIVDKSGTLSSITNSLSIIAGLRPEENGGATNGERVAMDLRANTSGVTIVQNPNPNSTDDAPINPLIQGDILLGSGADTVQIKAGSVNGALDYGTGGGSLSIEGGASYRGELRAGDQLNSISIQNGTLTQTNAGTVQSGSLDIGAKGKLVVAADPSGDKASVFQVNGTATIAEGGKIGLAVLSLPTQTQTFTVLNAQTLNVAGSTDGLLESSPYLVVASADVDQAAGDIRVNLRRRTAEEAGFAKFEADAYDAVYEALPLDQNILGAFLGQTTRDGLIGLYDQLLPDHAGGVVRGLSWAQEAAGRAAADWPRSEEMTGPTRAWTQEIGLGETKDRDQAAGWRIYGFGAAGGLESVAANGSALGVMVNFATANVKNPDTPGDDIVGATQLGAAVYWRAAFGRLRADAQAGAGWIWADTRREFVASVNGQNILRRATADWTGYSLYGRVGLAYEMEVGRLIVLPSTHLDYYRLSEGGYTEEGGGDGFDLDVESRTSDVLSWTSSVIFGYRFGARTIVRPELELGWRQVLSGSGGSTTARFVGGSGAPFTLFGELIEGGAPIARMGVRVSSQYLDLKLDAGGEFRDEYTDVDVRLTVRIVF